MNKKTKIIPLLLGVTILSFMVGAIIFAQVWREPGSLPPGGNVAAPINVGTTTQHKVGVIGATRFVDFDDQMNNFRWFVDPASSISAAFRGNVGIGTTAPTTALTVHAVGPWPTGWGPGIHTWDLYAGGTVAAGTGGALNAWMSRDGHAFFAGNVGIGTTAPGARLDVWDGDVILGRPQAIHGATHRQFKLHGAWNNLYIAPRNDANTAWLWHTLVVHSAGNVGIGTTTPAARLHVIPPTAGGIAANMGGGRITNVAAPVDSGDVATRGWVEAVMPSNSSCPREIEHSDRSRAILRDAVSTCRALGYGWRLPTMEELSCFIGIHGEQFLLTRTHGTWYFNWSNTSGYYSMLLVNGALDRTTVGHSVHFRCVR